MFNKLLPRRFDPAASVTVVLIFLRSDDSLGKVGSLLKSADFNAVLLIV